MFISERVAADLISPIAPTIDRGNRWPYILTMGDYAARYPKASTLKSIETKAVTDSAGSKWGGASSEIFF